jgi:uncharacterized protein (DUF924 family)
MTTSDDPERVLSFWLALDEESQFAGGDIDSRMKEAFGALLDEGIEGRLDRWAETPRGALALVILLDQFSRNIHRGTARMYAGDAKALAVARAALANGLDRQVGAVERLWFYMPFMHSEGLADQELCIELLTRAGLSGNIPYAVEHRDVISRFGRFPHRNAILGRASTAEEDSYLAERRQEE